MTRVASHARRWLGRAALAVIGAAVAIALGELGVRALRLGEYGTPTLRSDDAKVVAELPEIARFFFRADADASGSKTQMPSSYVARGWYDRPKWAYFDADGCVEYRTNSLGFRDREFPVARRPDELRILALGDSFTFGQGVQLEDCWVQVLERELARTRAGPVEVINGGYCRGSKPDEYAVWLPTNGLELDPDLVIVGVCLNDLFLDLPLVTRPPGSVPPLGGRIRLLALANQLVAEWDALPPPAWNVKTATRRAPESPKQFKEGLLSIQKTLATRQIPLLVAVFPMMTQLDEHYPFKAVHALVRDFCAEHSIACVDLLDRFLGRDARELWVHPTDQHPNDVGQRLLAEGIRDWLAEHPVPPRSAR